MRPLLAEHCWSCHGPEKQKGDLRLDSLAGALQGGESGPSLSPGKVDDSLIIQAIRYESFEMPPKAKLPDTAIAVLSRWVAMGAPWPGSNDTPAPRTPQDKFSAEDRAWWAIQPLREPAIPSTESSANPIDAFIAQKQAEHGLSFAPPADRITLIRRLYFDLIGLPPTPAQVQAFVSDESSDAYESLVDSLLDSPQYGEHWARHWLDLVRYADSDGYRIDHYRPHAWRYRDYVVRSFNSDKPYDRFVQEQIAGDEMFPGDLDALTATGYLRHWIYEYNNRDARTQWTTILNDITDTTGDVFLGLGMQCAKCHDHKFDPILQKDYYRLQAFFAPVLPHDDVVATEQSKAEYAEKLAAWESATKTLRDELESYESQIRERLADEAIAGFPPDIQAMIRKPVNERTPQEHQIAELASRQIYFEYSRLDTKLKGDEKERVLALRKELSSFDNLKPKELPVAMVVRDTGREPPPIRMPKRNKDPIDPGVLTLICETPMDVQPPADLPSTGRRTALAKWMTEPTNPLTTRVIANRIWQYHFGRGLVPNSSDFGRLGGLPSHPELLDWLAVEFVRDGWSFKSLHRKIVNSRVYRQSTAHPESVPSNRSIRRTNTIGEPIRGD